MPPVVLSANTQCSCPSVCSGVLDVAASVVALLKRFFSEHIDALEPEQAFLEVGW